MIITNQIPWEYISILAPVRRRPTPGAAGLHENHFNSRPREEASAGKPFDFTEITISILAPVRRRQWQSLYPHRSCKNFNSRPREEASFCVFAVEAIVAISILAPVRRRHIQMK